MVMAIKKTYVFLLMAMAIKKQTTSDLTASGPTTPAPTSSDPTTSDPRTGGWMDDVKWIPMGTFTRNL